MGDKMSRWLELAWVQERDPNPCDSVTNGDKTQPEVERAGFVTFCHLSHGKLNENQPVGDHPDLDAFEERAAISEFDGGLSRADAEELAAQCQGYENVVAFRSAQTKASE
jgi:hypothetical protein